MIYISKSDRDAALNAWKVPTDDIYEHIRFDGIPSPHILVIEKGCERIAGAVGQLR